jgi:hypothetical protein
LTQDSLVTEENLAEEAKKEENLNVEDKPNRVENLRHKFAKSESDLGSFKGFKKPPRMQKSMTRNMT